MWVGKVGVTAQVELGFYLQLLGENALALLGYLVSVLKVCSAVYEPLLNVYSADVAYVEYIKLTSK